MTPDVGRYVPPTPRPSCRTCGVADGTVRVVVHTTPHGEISQRLCRQCAYELSLIVDVEVRS